MAGVIRYSTGEGFTLDPRASGATQHTSSSPERTDETAPAQNELNERVNRAFHTNFSPQTLTPTLRGLVIWLIKTEFKDSFFGVRKLSETEQKNSIQGIFRTLQGNQRSLESTLTLEGRAQKGTPPREPPFRIVYSMLRNGFNGLRYHTDTPIADLDIKKEAKAIYELIHGDAPIEIKTVQASDQDSIVEDSVISSLLRCAHGLSCARAMKLGRGDDTPRTICYAARPDTCAKLQELVTMLFWTEQREGRINLDDWDEETPIDLRFVINSLISTFSAKDILAPGEMTEYKLLLEELKLLAEYAGKEMEIANPENPEQKIVVRLNYKIYCGNFNFVNALEKALPQSISGQLRAHLISDTVNDLEALIPKEKMTKRIQGYLTQLRKGRLSSEETLLLRFLIAQEAGLPTVIHCRSCVDRTTIAAAMIYALNQWTDLGYAIPENPLDLLDSEDFKELFWDHIAHAIEISAYSRKEGGYKWHTTPFKWFTQHPTVLRLMPNRLQQQFNFFDLSFSEMGELIFNPKCLKKWKGLYLPVVLGTLAIATTLLVTIAHLPLLAIGLSALAILFILTCSKYVTILPFFLAVSAWRKIASAKENSTPENLKLAYRIPIGVAFGALSMAMMTLLFFLGTIAGCIIRTGDYIYLKKMRFVENRLRKQQAREGEEFTPLQDVRTPLQDVRKEITKNGREKFFPLRLGLGLALLPFTLIPKQILRKGIYIQRAGGEKVPVLFEDTPIQSAK